MGSVDDAATTSITHRSSARLGVVRINRLRFPGASNPFEKVSRQVSQLRRIGAFSYRKQYCTDFDVVAIASHIRGPRFLKYLVFIPRGPELSSQEEKSVH